MGIQDNLPVKEFYNDTLSPSMKQIGSMLENALKTARFLWAPFDIGAAFQDKYQRYLKRISEKVPEDKLIEGHPQIVVPVFQGLMLSYEKSLLSEMFLSLLTNALSSDRQNLSHPAFPIIINQLSHDEAVILYYIKKKKYSFKDRHIYSVQPHTFLRKERFYDEFPMDKLLFPPQFLANVNHLISLSLVFVDIGDYYSEESTDETITNIHSGQYELTDFGRLFAESCVPDIFQSIS